MGTRSTAPSTAASQDLNHTVKFHWLRVLRHCFPETITAPLCSFHGDRDGNGYISLIARQVLPLANENPEEHLWVGQRDTGPMIDCESFSGALREKAVLLAFDRPLPLLSVERAESLYGLLRHGRFLGGRRNELKRHGL